ncbi:MAG: transcriptional regulator [Clostridia bacterium]|nr:transcriptional regulator [Clostridia bacterium]
MDYYELAAELLHLLATMPRHRVEQKMDKIGKGENFALHFLSAHHNEAYPKELSQGMTVSTARIAVILRKLEQQGMITRTVDAYDNRQIVVRLTEKGIEKVKEDHKEMLEVFARMLEKLGPDDAMAYIRIQKKLRDIYWQ